MDFDLSKYSHLPKAAQDNLLADFTAEECVVVDQYGYYSIEKRNNRSSLKLVHIGALSDEVITKLNCDNARLLTSHHVCYCGHHK